MSFLPPAPPPLTAQGAPKATAQSVLAAPRLPVTRWNRRYLFAGGAVIAGLVAVAFWIGFGGGGRGAAKTADTQPQGEAAPATSAFSGRYAKGYADPAVQTAAEPGTASLPPGGASLSSPPSAAALARAPDPGAQQAEQQAGAARAASPFFASTAQTGAQFAPPLTLVSNGQAAAPPAEETAAADVTPANGQGGKRRFLAASKLDDDLANPLREPQSPWEVKAGTVISAALLTAINSDLPGEIIAQVTEPVYDHVTGKAVLIPQGSRLIGQYDSQIAYGQARALVAWNRIVMPNGRSINIGAMQGSDLTGASGLQDQVDGHFWQLARGLLLSTVFSVGAASAEDASARSSGSLVLNSAGSGVSTQAQKVGDQIATRDLNRQPTIRVRAGWPLRVLVNKDMILAPYP